MKLTFLFTLASIFLSSASSAYGYGYGYGHGRCDTRCEVVDSCVARASKCVAENLYYQARITVRETMQCFDCQGNPTSNYFKNASYHTSATHDRSICSGIVADDKERIGLCR